jgi:hypothetical protein
VESWKLSDERLFLFFRPTFLRTGADRFDFYASQFAAMPDRAVVAFPPFEFERDHLFVFPLLDDFSGHFRATKRDVASIDMDQRFKCRDFTRLDIEKIDIHRITFCDAVLTPASFENCVSHKSASRMEKEAQRSTNAMSSQEENIEFAPLEGHALSCP